MPRDGANVMLLDGHVERVAFPKLWAVDPAGKVRHSFWYLEERVDTLLP